MLNLIWGLGVVSTTPKAFGGGLATPRPKPKPFFPFCFFGLLGVVRSPPKLIWGGRTTLDWPREPPIWTKMGWPATPFVFLGF